MQALLAELPGIFERKFQQRLEPILQQQHQLQEENSGLRDQMRQLPPAAAPHDPEWPNPRQPSLLMPSLPQRREMRITRQRRNSDPA